MISLDVNGLTDTNFLDMVSVGCDIGKHEQCHLSRCECECHLEE